MDLSKRLTIASVGALLAAVALLGLDVRAEAGDNFNEPRGIRWVEGPNLGIPDSPDIDRPQQLHPESRRDLGAKSGNHVVFPAFGPGSGAFYVAVPTELEPILRWISLRIGR